MKTSAPRVGEQLTIFGLWEPAAAPPASPDEPPSPLVEPPIDPRQVDLLSGPQTLRATLLDACTALDATATRRAHADLVRKFIGQRWAERAPEWAEGIDWLVGSREAQITAAEQVERALSLRDEEAARGRFPEISEHLFGRIRASALRRGAERLVAEGGPAARLAGGRPAGWLLLIAGDWAQAHSFLVVARDADAAPDARLLGYLGEAAGRMGDEVEALRVCVHASLVDATAIDEEMLTCRAVMDLVDEAEERGLPESPLHYLPVLADLLGRLRLDDAALSPPPGAGPARRLAALLRRYRRRRSSPDFDEAARLVAKREMIKIAAPGLRELLRGL